MYVAIIIKNSQLSAAFFFYSNSQELLAILYNNITNVPDLLATDKVVVKERWRWNVFK